MSKRHHHPKVAFAFLTLALNCADFYAGMGFGNVLKVSELSSVFALSVFLMAGAGRAAWPCRCSHHHRRQGYQYSESGFGVSAAQNVDLKAVKGADVDILLGAPPQRRKINLKILKWIPTK